MKPNSSQAKHALFNYATNFNCVTNSSNKMSLDLKGTIVDSGHSIIFVIPVGDGF